MKPVAIIGGGITGLAAAWQLRQRNIPVRIFEAGRELGGPIRTFVQDGFLAEAGPNTVLETAPEIGRLIRQLNLDSRQLYSDPKAENRYLVRNRQLLPVPGSPLGFFRSRLFSTRAKLNLLGEPFRPRRRDGVEESVAQFVLRRLGREFLDYAINPLVAGIYAGDPARLSVQHAFAKVYDLEKNYGSMILGQIFGARARRRRAEVSKQAAKKFSFDRGLQVLIDTLGERLADRIYFESPVAGLERAADGWKVRARNLPEPEEFAAVLFSGTAHQLAALELSGGDPADLGLFRQIVYPPVASVVLGFRRQQVRHPLDGFGALIPAVEPFRILGTIFSSSLFPNRAPQGCVTLTSYAGGSRAPELALRPADELFQIVGQDLSVLLGIEGEPVFKYHTAFPKAIPQYEVGFGKFKAAYDALEKRWPGFFLAGHFRNGISLGDCLVAAFRAAERIDTFLSANSRSASSSAAAICS